ncbi:5-methylcytosine rRNA methyltransferase NSUN4 [Leptidea sinapis]|uniref:5-methylcytosine rRNA methyltransferase NSUN4 n=1 Tax=Leptidea sinapis TaxID=189913 RepID=UPI0021445D1D|nr:5-methylcytosine rRNA methyltransferase NSUN4 [Leptidea sinapis]
MFSVTKIPKTSSIYFSSALKLRHKSKTHWAKLKRKTGPKYTALNHFDDFYGSVFGNQWESIREGLLRRPKYVAVINNYGDFEETMELLSNKGAHCLNKLMSIQQDFSNTYHKINKDLTKDVKQESNVVSNYVSKMEQNEISNIYPTNQALPEKLELKDTTLKRFHENEVEIERTSAQTLDDAIAEADIDQTRIIEPGMGTTSEALYQYIPATKLKGMDDYVSESLHYSFYSTNTSDFPLVIEPETEYSYPEHLKLMTYERDSELHMFPEPKRSQTGVFNYYPLDGGSVLAVLALCLQPGDRVLDMCAAPGGKSLIALQTLLPDVLVCNDVSISRSNRIKNIFRNYLIDFETSNKWQERVVLNRKDGRNIVDDYGFDKVLVDVPCTTDRHAVMENENNIFRADRVRERLRIPELQSQLLANALRVTRVGGAVVYSTCSLSPVQNDGVVHMALKQVFTADGILASVRDMSSAFQCLSSTMVLGKGKALPKYGQLVLPSVSANFGPSYIARLVRTK